MGLLLLLEGRLGLLSRGGNWRRWFAGGRLWTAPLLGAAFAITWTPCIGPVLGAVLTLAGSTADLTRGVVLLAAYSLGLGLPFLALPLSLNRVRGWLRRLGRGDRGPAVGVGPAAGRHGRPPRDRPLAAADLTCAGLVRAGPLAAPLVLR